MKILIEAGHILSLVQIFDTIPRSVVAKDFGTNYKRFSRLVENPDLFRMKEIFTLAKLFEIDEMKMVGLILSQYKSDVLKPKKSH